MARKKNTWVLIMCSMVALSLMIGCAKDVPVEDDAAKLEGTWVGPEVEHRDQGDWTFTFSGNLATANLPTGESYYKGTVTINSETDPKQVDFAIEECFIQDFVGKTTLGIYQFEENKLILAACEPGTSQRPASFENNEGGGLWALTKE